MPKKLFIIHPLLFAIFPVLFLFSQNMGQVSPNIIFAPLLVSIVIAVVLYFTLRVFLKDREKAALAVSFFLTLFFSYGHVYQIAEARGLGRVAMLIPIKPEALLLYLYGGIFISAFIFLLKLRIKLDAATRLFNFISIFLIIGPLMNIGIYSLTEKRIGWSDNSWKDMAGGVNVSENPKLPKKIYFIILDSYASEDVLKKMYRYDNSGFLKHLNGKGFYVFPNARANYCRTVLSLASCLNLDYIDNLTNIKLIINSDNMELPKMMIKNNRVFRFLRQRGYKIIAFASGAPETELTGADIYINPGWAPDEFENAVMNTTPVPAILNLAETKTVFDLYRKRVLYALDHLSDTAKIKSPAFIFCHIVMPHPPFIFNRYGEKIRAVEMFNDEEGNWLAQKRVLSGDEYIKYYTDQLMFINERIKMVLGEILSKSETQPIIVLQADHGPHSKLFLKKSDNENFKECLSILNSCYLPGNGKKLLYDGMTPVNTFRVIFNSYFDGNYEMLADRSFFSSAVQPYKFIDVSDAID